MRFSPIRVGSLPAKASEIGHTFDSKDHAFLFE